MESVKKFAGEHPEKAKYYPEDDFFLLEKEETSALYEVFFEKLCALPIKESLKYQDKVFRGLRL
jgi:hypothetical protein